MIRLTLILIFLFIGCAKTPGEPSDGNEIEEEEFNNSLDIMTWNLQNFPKDPITVEYVINLIISSNLDIIALQEIERVSRDSSFVVVDAYRTKEEKKLMYAWNLTGKTIMHVDEWKFFSRRC